MELGGHEPSELSLSCTLAPGDSEHPGALWGTAPQPLLCGLGPSRVEGLVLVLGLSMGKGILAG